MTAPSALADVVIERLRHPELRDFDVAEIVSSLLPALDPRHGEALVDRALRAWGPRAVSLLADDRCATWLVAPRARLCDAAVAAPRDASTLRAYCHLYPWLPRDAQDAAFAALLDETVPLIDGSYGKPVSLYSLHRSVLRARTADDRERWIAAHASACPRDFERVDCEIRLRLECDQWPESRVRELWARATRDGVGDDLLRWGLIRVLPPELRSEALARDRGRARRSQRLFHLAQHGEALTLEEVIEVVQTPWLEADPGDRPVPEGERAEHLSRCARDGLLARVAREAPAVFAAQLALARGMKDRSAQDEALFALMPWTAERDLISAHLLERARGGEVGIHLGALLPLADDAALASLAQAIAQRQGPGVDVPLCDVIRECDRRAPPVREAVFAPIVAWACAPRGQGMDVHYGRLWVLCALLARPCSLYPGAAERVSAALLDERLAWPAVSEGDPAAP